MSFVARSVAINAKPIINRIDRAELTPAVHEEGDRFPEVRSGQRSPMRYS